jgi:hypothetical protein
VQFDTLHESQVVWEPYNLEARAVRAPHLGLSPMCFRDQGFWMTKEKLVFDVYVRDHSPQRAMRQFGLYQEFPPPAGDVVNRARQSWSRQGANTLPAEWERRLGPYVAAWAQADQVGHVWREERPFNASFFQLYLQWYVPRTRVFLVRRAEQEDIPQAVAPTGTYSLHSVEERHAAGLSLAQIEWDMVHMVGRLDLGRPPTRDELLSVGEVARTARQRLGFAHVSDLLPRGCHLDFQQPASSGQPGPSTQQYPGPPPYTQPGGGLPGPRGLGPRPRSPEGLLGRPRLGLRRTRSREGPPGSTRLLLPIHSREDLPVSSQVRYLPPRAEAVPGQAGTPRDLLPRFQVIDRCAAGREARAPVHC